MNHRRPLDHNVPSLLRILLMKPFYVSFLDYLNETAVFEIVLFSVILITSIISQDYKLPIAAIVLYFVTLILVRANRYRAELHAKLLEESLELLKSQGSSKK